MAFNVFKDLCNHNHSLILEYFLSPQKKPHVHFQSLPFSSPLPQSWAATHLLSDL